MREKVNPRPKLVYAPDRPKTAENAAAVALPSREIPERVDALFHRSEHLSERLSAVHGRLRPVLRNVPLDEHKRETVAASTDLGEQLAAIATRMDLIIDTVDLIDSLLEL